MPDLADAGMTFVGGRLLFTAKNEPIGQIAYHDRRGQLFAFCLMANPNGSEKAPTRGQNGDLNTVSWSDQSYRYVVIGWAGFDEIGPIAERLRRDYGKDS